MHDTFYPTYQLRRRRNRGRRFAALLVVLILGGIILYLFSSHISELKKKRAVALVNPASSVKPFNIVLGGTVKSASVTPIGKVVQDQLVGTTGTYAVSIKNLKTGETYASNDHLTFESGSLYKLWIMAVAFKQIKSGQLTEDQVLSEDIETLNKKFGIDPEVAEQTEGTITMSIKLALNQMITISHNYAALLLTAKERLSTVDAYLKEQNFNESTVGIKGDLPTTSAYDIELFLEKLYTGKLADPDSNAKMLDLLKYQKLNGKLPKYLPDDITVAHKTGELGTVSHDAGIVYTPQGDYIIVVFSDSAIPAAAEDRIAKVSEAVYNYFTKGGEK